ncbi:MAG: nucleotidyltransferase family protein [Pseudomonadota bacterium]|nr:nucleotidyltransferase family protein [Rhodobacteraceae bacterium G21628-S1]MEE2809365.1 nucleotidyltransferase family protein [Pseudomonadota bacterium]
MTAPTAVMIFAAGFGTRMGAHTADRPKPMIPVAGRPLIDHALDLVSDISPQRIVINTHYKAEVLATHLEGRDVLISHEGDEILDTGGGLKQARALLDATCSYTLNPDVAWRGPNPLMVLRDAWRPEHMDALLLCVPTVRAVGRLGAGDFTASNAGHITRGGDLVYTGAQIIKLDQLDRVTEKVFSLNALWDLLIPDARVSAVEYPGQWCDVGRPEGIALAENMMAHANV